jgi:ribosomal protein L37AE/L43A
MSQHSYFEVQCNCRTWRRESTGSFYCEKCRTLVVIEWPEPAKQNQPPSPKQINNVVPICTSA